MLWLQQMARSIGAPYQVVSGPQAWLSKYGTDLFHKRIQHRPVLNRMALATSRVPIQDDGSTYVAGARSVLAHGLGVPLFRRRFVFLRAGAMPRVSALLCTSRDCQQPS